MAWVSLLICSVVSIMLVPTTGVPAGERRSLIDAAIRSAKHHAEVQNAYADNVNESSRQASPLTLQQGRARLLYEDIVHRAEMKILEKKRAGVQDSKDEVEILAKELLHTPGHLLTVQELAWIYQQSGCSNLHPNGSALNCTQQTNKDYRTPSGECNNLDNPLFGAAPSVFRRLIPPQYEDGVSRLRGTLQSEGSSLFMGPFAPPNPSARIVSTNVIRDVPVDDKAFTHFLMQWGQWVGGDLNRPAILSTCEEDNCDIEPERCVPIRVVSDDPVFSGEECLAFPRSIAACGDSPNVEHLRPREQINEISSFFDGSQVYGSSMEHMLTLREADANGVTEFLRTGENIPATGGPSLPRATESDIKNGFVACPDVSDGCFLAGDTRANHHTGLTVLHTIFMREHNRIASELKKINPQWSSNAIFGVTRHIVAAEIQKITYTDYLPKILGKETFDMLIGKYSGYDPKVDPTVPNGHATAGYQFTHSQFRPEFDRLDEDYKPLPIGPLSLADMFFQPARYEESGGTDPLLRGLLTNPSRRIDEFVTSILTNQVFAPNLNATDLASLDIQRGRDHGLPPYLTWKRWAARNDTCGLSSEIRGELTFIRLLETYGSLETVDLWVGGLAEERVPGGLVGATFACIFAHTFGPIRNGDRLYYENVAADGFFTEEQRDEIDKTSLSRIICDNADNITEIQVDAFLTGQQRVSCSQNISKMDLMAFHIQHIRQDPIEFRVPCPPEGSSVDKELVTPNVSTEEEHLISLLQGILNALDQDREESIEQGEEPADEQAEEPAEEQAEEPAEEQAEEPAEEQAEEATDEQAEEAAEEQAEELADEQVEEPTEELADEQAEEAAEEQAEEPADEQAEEPAEEQVEEPTEEQVEEPTEEAAEEQAEEAAEEQLEEPTEEAADEQAEEPTEEAAEEQVEEPAEEQAEEEQVEEPTEEQVEEPTEEAAEEQAEEPTEEQAEEPAEEQAEEAAEEQLEEPTEEAADEQAEEPTEEAAEEQVEEPAEEQAEEEQVEEPTEEQVEEPTEEAAEEQAEEPTEEQAEEPAEEQVEEPTEEAADEQAEEPADEQAEEPADEQAEEPADEQAEEPAEEQVEEPTEEAAEEQVEEPADEQAEEPADEQGELVEELAEQAESVNSDDDAEISPPARENSDDDVEISEQADLVEELAEEQAESVNSDDDAEISEQAESVKSTHFATEAEAESVNSDDDAEVSQEAELVEELAEEQAEKSTHFAAKAEAESVNSDDDAEVSQAEAESVNSDDDLLSDLEDALD